MPFGAYSEARNMRLGTILPLIVGLGAGVVAVWIGLRAINQAKLSNKPSDAVTVMDPQDKLDALRDWAIETVDKFRHVLGPRIAELNL